MVRKVVLIPCTEDRLKQLDVLLPALKKREHPTTEFFVCTPELRDPFDRGMTLNVAFRASKAVGGDVVVVHDVDTVPVTAFPEGYPLPTGDREIMHLYGHEHSCGGIVTMTAACFEYMGGFDSNPAWGGEDVAMQQRAPKIGVVVNKARLVPRFSGDAFVELDADANPVPNPEAHRAWETDMFGPRSRLRERGSFHPNLYQKGDLGRWRGVHHHGVTMIEDRVRQVKCRITKLAQ